MSDRLQVSDVARVAAGLTPSLIKAGMLQPDERLRVVREPDKFIIVQVEDSEGDLTSQHAAVSILGHGGRLSASPREAYYILTHLTPVVHAWGADAEKLDRYRAEMGPLED